MPLNINTVKLDNVGIRRDGQLTPAELDLEKIPSQGEILSISNVSYSFQTSMVSGCLLVSGTLDAVVECVCGRCLDSFELKLSNVETCHYYDDLHADEIDVAPDLREDILIAIPSGPLCSEDCAGLCPACGANRNREACDCETARTAARNEDGNNPWSALDALDTGKLGRETGG
jgi:uncharacterized protein